MKVAELLESLNRCDPASPVAIDLDGVVCPIQGLFEEADDEPKGPAAVFLTVLSEEEIEEGITVADLMVQGSDSVESPAKKEDTTDVSDDCGDMCGFIPGGSPFVNYMAKPQEIKDTMDPKENQ